MHARMYVCMQARMYVCMQVSTYVYMCVCAYVCMQVCTYVCVYVRVCERGESLSNARAQTPQAWLAKALIMRMHTHHGMTEVAAGGEKDKRR